MKGINGQLFKRAFVAAAVNLDAHRELVDALNVFPVPDGDTGTNMSKTILTAAESVKQANGEDIGKVIKAASNGALMGARGNSGVILSQLLRGFYKGTKDIEELGIVELAAGLDHARETAYKAVMKPVEGTMLTIARVVAEKALELSTQDMEIEEFMEALLAHGDEVLEQTPDMLAALKEAGVVDSGGKGVMLLLHGFYAGLTGKIAVQESLDSVQMPSRTLQPNEEIEEGYCTNFMVLKPKGSIDDFRNILAKLGDSMVIAEAEDIFKVHIHSKKPGVILQEALKLGELTEIEIDNMRFQQEEKNLKDMQAAAPIEKKPFSFLSVSAGRGFSEVFKSLGADQIIAGGQTMNPSTEDLVAAIERTGGETVYILPNNGNIVLTAQQSAKLSKRDVRVIPTKTMPEGIAAMLAFHTGVSADDNEVAMLEALPEITTGQITFAVRDTRVNGIDIQVDDIIGIGKKEILCKGDEMNAVTTILAEKLVDDADIITIYYGEDVEEEKAKALVETFEEVFDDIDIELVYGGQPVYYYSLSIE